MEDVVSLVCGTCSCVLAISKNAFIGVSISTPAETEGAGGKGQNGKASRRELRSASSGSKPNTAASAGANGDLPVGAALPTDPEFFDKCRLQLEEESPTLKHVVARASKAPASAANGDGQPPSAAPMQLRMKTVTCKECKTVVALQADLKDAKDRYFLFFTKIKAIIMPIQRPTPANVQLDVDLGDLINKSKPVKANGALVNGDVESNGDPEPSHMGEMITSVEEDMPVFETPGPPNKLDAPYDLGRDDSVYPPHIHDHMPSETPRLQDRHHDFLADIEQIMADVAGLKEDMRSMKRDIFEMKRDAAAGSRSHDHTEEIDHLSTSVSRITGRLGELDTLKFDVNTLQRRYQRLQDRQQQDAARPPITEDARDRAYPPTGGYDGQDRYSPDHRDQPISDLARRKRRRPDGGSRFDRSSEDPPDYNDDYGSSLASREPRYSSSHNLSRERLEQRDRAYQAQQHRPKFHDPGRNPGEYGNRYAPTDPMLDPRLNGGDRSGRGY